jgi:hypothetical protein
MRSCCCGGKDRLVDLQLIKFCVQVALTGMMLIFCIYQLIAIEECEKSQFYSALLSALIFYWLPAPSTPTIERGVA